jgi:hypothetical protein
VPGPCPFWAVGIRLLLAASVEDHPGHLDALLGEFIEVVVQDRDLRRAK